MSKRGGFPGGMGGFGGMNLGNIMKQAKKMQEDMAKSQEVLAQKEFEAVSVKVSGDKLVKEIKLQKEVVDPDDVEMLEDLVLTCVNEALRKVNEAQASELGKYNIPGLM